jgi:hypothetical protein
MTYYCVDYVHSDPDLDRDLTFWFVGTDPDPDPAQTLFQANN